MNDEQNRVVPFQPQPEGPRPFFSPSGVIGSLIWRNLRGPDLRGPTKPRFLCLAGQKK